MDNVGLRAGIIGTGFIGTVHNRAARRAGASRVVIADVSEEAAAAAAQRLGADLGYSSADALLADPEVDVVHICTPNHLHADLAARALAAGKHVICEKPLATDVEAAMRLATLAQGSGLVTGVPFVYRYYPTAREIRGRVGRGDAGSLHLLHGSYLQDWLAQRTDTNWRVDPALGGASRAFGDIGIHWCDLAEFLTGHRIARLSAVMSTPLQRAGGATATATEDIAAVLFQTDQGASGSLVVSQVSLGRKNRLQISVDGELGAFAFDQEQPDSYWNGRLDGAMVVPRGAGEQTEEGARFSYLPAGHPQGYQDCFDAFVANVYGAVRGGPQDGLPTFQDGLRGAVLTDAVLRSARSGEWVDVQPAKAPLQRADAAYTPSTQTVP